MPDGPDARRAVWSAAVAITIDLSGRAALVTGAGAGIGFGIATWLGRAGCAVAVNDISPDRAEQAAVRLENEGVNAIAVPADARDEAEVRAMVARVIGELGGLDVAVNNVGMNAGARAAPFWQLDPVDVRAVLEQNLVATAVCGIVESAAMVEAGRGGVIINVSSGETTRPALNLAPYGAAKAAINHLTQTMAAELGPHAIRVYAIAPGTTLTETVRAAFTDEMYASIVAATPLRRSTEIDELGRLVVFLASDLARCITGQFILADAGAHLSRSRPVIPAKA